MLVTVFSSLLRSQRIATKLAKQEGQNSGQGSSNTIYEKEQYYYHPDHLGSSSFITDEKGKVYEHLEYFPSGETFAHEHSNTQVTPYRFTGKEYDEMTGLYYYGARYYDPRTSVWQSPDQILGEYMSGKTNGGVFNPKTLSLFTYTNNNPVNLVDPDGNRVFDFYVRSFAPVEKFGGFTSDSGFDGDNRGFTTNTGVTSRISYLAHMNTDNNTVSAGATSSPSKIGSFSRTAIDKSSEALSDNGDFKFSYEGSNPLVPFFAPDVDVHGKLNFKDNTDGSFSITGNINGDKFPSAEAFVIPKGSKTGIFIGVSQIDKNQDLDGFSVFNVLRGDNKRPMMNINMTIGFDNQGNANSVTSGGVRHTVPEWNSKFENTPAKEK